MKNIYEKATMIVDKLIDQDKQGDYQTLNNLILENDKQGINKQVKEMGYQDLTDLLINRFEETNKTTYSWGNEKIDMASKGVAEVCGIAAFGATIYKSLCLIGDTLLNGNLKGLIPLLSITSGVLLLNYSQVSDEIEGLTKALFLGALPIMLPALAAGGAGYIITQAVGHSITALYNGFIKLPYNCIKKAYGKVKKHQIRKMSNLVCETQGKDL